jgi:hypothetical protein
MKLVFCVAAASLSLAATVNAYAALGGNLQSVVDDQVKLSASISSTTSGAFTVHTLQQQGGDAVREYMDQSGRVVAVAWNGRASPRLGQLLGETYAARLGAPGARRIGGHRVMSLHESDFVVESIGSMRAGFTGHAYLTSAINASVTPDQFK